METNEDKRGQVNEPREYYLLAQQCICCCRSPYTCGATHKDRDERGICRKWKAVRKYEAKLM